MGQCKEARLRCFESVQKRKSTYKTTGSLEEVEKINGYDVGNVFSSSETVRRVRRYVV